MQLWQMQAHDFYNNFYDGQSVFVDVIYPKVLAT